MMLSKFVTVNPVEIPSEYNGTSNLGKYYTSYVGKNQISRISTKQWKGKEEYHFVKNTFGFYSLFHKCNSVWWYNVPKYHINSCLKCKKEIPNGILLQYNLLKDG